MWNELIFTIEQTNCDRASEILTVLNHDGMFIEDFSDLMENDAVKQTNLVEQDLLDKINNDPVIHLYISPSQNLSEMAQTAQSLLDQNMIPYTIAVKPIPDKNWNEEWMKYYKPVHISDHITVVPCWLDYEKREDELIITLDPGAAFGTGTHETTKLCLSALERYTTPSCRMLDIGTGSGILAITSLLLGAQTADAVDIDPLSIKAAHANAALNHVENRLDVKLGNLLDTATGQYQVITANIVADVIISMLPNIKNFMDPSSVLILSGIIKEREHDVLDAINTNQYDIIEHLNDGEWVAFVAKNKLS
jgi:ribosomal protein L11 methyltransferase